MKLTALGWHPFFEHQFKALERDDLIPARVSAQHRGAYEVLHEQGSMSATLSGRFLHDAAGREQHPAVGDWVGVAIAPEGGHTVIHVLLNRRSAFLRHAAGEQTEAQVVAANVDTVFLVCGLDHDFNVRRIERYLTTAWDSGANPVVVLNKADICENLDSCQSEVEGVAMGVPIHAVSASTGAGMETLRQHLAEGRTAALLGSSGVGKSTIVNYLVGEERQATGTYGGMIHGGRHTTTYRELVLLPEGGLLLDTPGMRELQLWADQSALDNAFAEIETLAKQCRYSDCCHEEEPGCAVREAVASGELPEERFLSYLKLRKELDFLERKQDQRLAQVERDKWKHIAKDARRIRKIRGY